MLNRSAANSHLLIPHPASLYPAPPVLEKDCSYSIKHSTVIPKHTRTSFLRAVFPKPLTKHSSTHFPEFKAGPLHLRRQASETKKCLGGIIIILLLLLFYLCFQQSSVLLLLFKNAFYFLSYVSNKKRVLIVDHITEPEARRPSECNKHIFMNTLRMLFKDVLMSNEKKGTFFDSKSVRGEPNAAMCKCTALFSEQC